MVKKTTIAPPDPTPAQLAARAPRVKLDAATEDALARKDGGFLGRLRIPPAPARVTQDELQAALDAEEHDRSVGKGWCAWWIIAEDKEEFQRFPKLADDRVTYLRQLSVLYKITQELRDYTVTELNSSPALLGTLARLGYIEKTRFGHRALPIAREAWTAAAAIGRDRKFSPRKVDKPPQGVTKKVEYEFTTANRGSGELRPVVERGAARPPRQKVASTARVTLLVDKNPHKAGTDYHGYFEALRPGGTVDEYVARGGHRIALAKYVKQGVVRLEGEK